MIDSINFSLLSPQLIKRMSAVEITKAELYDNDGFPLEGGVMDPHLGVIDPGLRCRRCGKSSSACFGHFGHLELIRPVINVLYVKLIYKILKATCRECSRVITTTPTIPKKCPFCSAEQKTIKFEKPYAFMENEKIITPRDIRERFEKIPDEELHLLGMTGGRPEWLIITLLPIPPVIMRPSITLETGVRSEDDLTHKLVDIIRINQRLKENIEIGAPEFIIEDLWELLQYHVATFFDNSLSGIPVSRHRSGRPLKTLADRLKSKEGRFRQNLSGKRVNFSARTVISPDPCISINEVGVPLVIAKDLTIPVLVQNINIEQCRELVLRGPNIWPGANYVIRSDGKKKKIAEENQEEIAKELAPGYTVERHIQNGDIVLFNRQPSLHRMSLMAHRVRVTPWRTFTLNLCVCPPYNADFDGDEMNLHVLQTEEAQVEAKLLMEVQRNIRSPRFGGPIIGCEHDHISGAYMLTTVGTELPREFTFQILSEIGLDVKLPKGKSFSGKEVFSFLLPKGLNIEFRANACIGCAHCKKKKCPYDAYVVIRNGKLKTGVIDTAAIGRETGKLIDVIEKEFGTDSVHHFIDNVSLLAIKYLEQKGFTIGLDDVDLTKDVIAQVHSNIESAKADAKKLIGKYETGQLEPLAGMDIKESLEAYIRQVFANAMGSIGEIVSKSAQKNCAIIMARSGARGSVVHLTQLSACVGQENVLGERIHRGYKDRTLSHFSKGNISAEACGFVASSFKSGLNPFEFFFDAVSGRESLMDKSLRTRHSGYLERRLMNALQDLKVEYDGTVRDNRKVIIQFIPGEDKIDPSKSDWGTLDIRAIIQSVLR